MASHLRERLWAEYKQRLVDNKKPRVSRAKELAEARVLIERVEARRKAMGKREREAT